WRQMDDRRAKILSAIAHVARICEARTNSPLAGQAITPEPDQSPQWPDEARALRDYAEYLYEGIWRDLCDTLGISVQRIAGETDKVFANFRGLVLSTRGTGPPLEPEVTANTGNEAFRRFDKVEANATLKGFWPFFRRLRPEADYRDWVACGVFDWRALYV